MGLLGMLVPEEYGGAGIDTLDLPAGRRGDLPGLTRRWR